MKKRFLAIGLIFLLLFSSVFPITIGHDIKIPDNNEQSSNRGNTLYVGGSGPGNYSTIQSAINAAVAGDTVFVYDDKSPYYERLSIKKSISLIGENRNTTVIDGEFKGVVVDIQADRVMVTGFKLINFKTSNNDVYNVVNIKNCDYVVIKDNLINVGHLEHNDWRCGVYLTNSSNDSIQDNIIFGGGYRTAGIAVNGPFNNISGNKIDSYHQGIGISGYNTVYGNYIHYCDFGIEYSGTKSEIINNIINKSDCYGITSNSGNALILGNTIINCGLGGEFDGGIMLSSGKNNEIKNNIISGNNPAGIHFLDESNYNITHNYISDNKQVGIWFDFSDNNSITDNNILNNKNLGIYVYCSNNNLITDNNISFNEKYGLVIDGGAYCKIYRNNFIKNGINAYFNVLLRYIFSNRWNRNYWSDSLVLSPKIIHGMATFIIFPIPWINIDWHPAKKPYDI